MPYIANYIYDNMCQEKAGHDIEDQMKIVELQAELKAANAMIDKLLAQMVELAREKK